VLLRKGLEAHTPFQPENAANRGQTIDLICRTLTNPTIFSFEPNPDLVPRLKDKYNGQSVQITPTSMINGLLIFGQIWQINLKITESERSIPKAAKELPQLKPYFQRQYFLINKALRHRLKDAAIWAPRKPSIRYTIE